MRLYAISDLHVASASSRDVVSAIPTCRNDWLILAGDIAETPRHLEWTLKTLRPKFEQLVWVPGNHDLWTLPSDLDQQRGEGRYQQLVELCRRYDVVTPEDRYPTWSSDGLTVVVAPLFLLYDYSFRWGAPSKDQALAEAVEAGVLCTDEFLLHPDPHLTREAWCRERVERTSARLAAIPDTLPTVLVSHFPLREDLVFLPSIPKFSLWCGTKLTDDWHRRFRAVAVVYGHIHVPRTSWRHSIRFEEVSIGSSWPEASNGIACSAPTPLRQVLPYP